MNGMSTSAVEFFTIVLNSGLIALAALAVASVIAFTAAFVLFREPGAEPSTARAGSNIDARPWGEVLASTACATGTPKAAVG